jgi:hypothetical protein
MFFMSLNNFATYLCVTAYAFVYNLFNFFFGAESSCDAAVP